MEMEGGLRPVARRMRLPTVAVMVDVCVALDLTDAARETLKLESALRVPDDGSKCGCVSKTNRRRNDKSNGGVWMDGMATGEYSTGGNGERVGDPTSGVSTGIDSSHLDGGSFGR